WRNEAVLAALARHGAAWVETDVDGAPAPADLPRSATWTYLRLRAPGYSAEALASWRRACATFEHAYVYFKHEDEALGPLLAARRRAHDDHRSSRLRDRPGRGALSRAPCVQPSAIALGARCRYAVLGSRRNGARGTVTRSFPSRRRRSCRSTRRIHCTSGSTRIAADDTFDRTRENRPRQVPRL